MTRLQQTAYNAQLAAALPVSDLGETVLAFDHGIISRQHCATYVLAVQRMDWFKAAFPAHSDPITVVGGKGGSHADALQRRIKIGTSNSNWGFSTPAPTASPRVMRQGVAEPLPARPMGDAGGGFTGSAGSRAAGGRGRREAGRAGRTAQARPRCRT